MTKILIILLLILAIYALGYIVTVGMIWLVLYLLNILGADIILTMNVWALGGIIYIAFTLLRQIFGK